MWKKLKLSSNTLCLYIGSRSNVWFKLMRQANVYSIAEKFLFCKKPKRGSDPCGMSWWETGLRMYVNGFTHRPHYKREKESSATPRRALPQRRGGGQSIVLQLQLQACPGRDMNLTTFYPLNITLTNDVVTCAVSYLHLDILLLCTVCMWTFVQHKLP